MDTDKIIEQIGIAIENRRSNIVLIELVSSNFNFTDITEKISTKFRVKYKNSWSYGGGRFGDKNTKVCIIAIDMELLLELLVHNKNIGLLLVLIPQGRLVNFYRYTKNHPRIHTGASNELLF